MLLLLFASLAVVFGVMAFVLSERSKRKALTDDSVKPRSQSWWYLTMVAAAGAVVLTISVVGMIVNQFL